MHNPTTPTMQRYAASLATIAARLVGAVHDDGPDERDRVLTDARALPAPPGVDPAAALAVTLAAMVDPTRTAGELLAWCAALDGGAADLHPAPVPLARPALVEHCLAGRLPIHALAEHEARRVIRIEVDRGRTDAEIADRHHAADPTRLRHWLTVARRAAAVEAAA
ncbi:hypothetical protein [Saccharopolyspora sp. 6V]|uniref:hypothetical protein n=1 Tax=Saccharopolyspora sp. 6V TaxID=2877239 RepID=UPI001CD2FD67|nr:hypothetical protein [Saccharopolyspora sp. 6V]MCA1195110.1 hypothetical protein [Saccharopolyspora sp. 6V]